MRKHFRMILCLLLANCLILGSFACSGGTSPATVSEQSKAEVPVSEEPSGSDEPGPAFSDEPVATGSDIAATAEATAVPAPAPTPAPLIQETVVVDNLSGVTVTAKELKETESGFELTIEAVNHAGGDYYLNLFPYRILINGIRLCVNDKYGYPDTICMGADGETDQGTFLIPRTVLNLLGIESIDTLTVSFSISLFVRGHESENRIDENSEPVDLIRNADSAAFRTPGTVFFHNGSLLLSALGLTEDKAGVYFYYDLYDPAAADGRVNFILNTADSDDYSGQCVVNGKETACTNIWIDNTQGLDHGIFSFYPVDANLTEDLRDLSISLIADYYGRAKRGEVEIPTIEMTFDENGLAVLNEKYIVDAPEFSPLTSSEAVSDEHTSVNIPENGMISIIESAVYENDQVKITISDIQGQDEFLVITAKVENKSDSAITVLSDQCAANGFKVGSMSQITSSFDTSIDPQSEGEIKVYVYDLENYGMNPNTVAEINISFLYGPPGAWTSNMTATDPISIQLDQKPAAESLDLSSYPALYDDNDVRIIFLGRSDTKTALRFYVENNTTGEIWLTADSKMQIDGYQTSDWTLSISAGMKQIVEYGVYEQNGSLLQIDWEIKAATVCFRLELGGKNLVTETLEQTFPE